MKFASKKGNFATRLGEEGGISCKIKKKGGRFQWLMKKVGTKMIPANKLGSSVAESDGVRKDQKRVYHKNGGLTI